MRMWRYGMAVGLLAGLGACSGLTENNHPVPGPGARAEPAVAPGMVKQVQSRPHDGGYDRQGGVDGAWGAETEAAVRSFQKEDFGNSREWDVATLYP